MKRLLILLALFPMLMFCACSKHWAEKDMSFENGCWDAKDTLGLEFESDDTTTVYTLQFPVTVDEDYAFNNIYLKAILTAPSGDQSEIPSEFKLSDPTGKWFAKPNGDEIPFELSLAEGLRFNQKGKYSIKLYHFMRDDMLCGVRHAGIAIDPMKLGDG